MHKNGTNPLPLTIHRLLRRSLIYLSWGRFLIDLSQHGVPFCTLQATVLSLSHCFHLSSTVRHVYLIISLDGVLRHTHEYLTNTIAASIVVGRHAPRPSAGQTFSRLPGEQYSMSWK